MPCAYSRRAAATRNARADGPGRGRSFCRAGKKTPVLHRTDQVTPRLAARCRHVACGTGPACRTSPPCHGGDSVEEGARDRPGSFPPQCAPDAALEPPARRAYREPGGHSPGPCATAEGLEWNHAAAVPPSPPRGPVSKAGEPDGMPGRPVRNRSKARERTKPTRWIRGRGRIDRPATEGTLVPWADARMRAASV